MITEMERKLEDGIEEKYVSFKEMNSRNKEAYTVSMFSIPIMTTILQ